MLAKKYRLPIQSVIGKNGESFKTPFFLVKKFPGGFPYPRFGVIISKKVSDKATERNRLKRIIFSAIESFLAEQKNKLPAKDFLIIVSPKIKELEKEKIIEQINLCSKHF